MKALILIVVLFLGISSATADENTFSYHFGGWSSHFVSGDFNESHQFHLIEYKKVIAGTFTNSFNNRAAILAYNFSKDYGQHIRVGVLAGGVTGYNRGEVRAVDYADVCPVLAPYVATRGFPVNLSLTAFGDGVLLTLRIDF